jgi:predicted dehydrogenase
MSMNRRAFLEMTAAAAMTTAAKPLFAARPQTSGPVGANERIRMAIIGSGSRGNQVLGSFAQVPNNVFSAACDVFKDRLDSTVQRLSVEGNKVDGYDDYRRVLDRKDIDAVLIATPDHWHPQITMDACTAGKDVYMEKPSCNAAMMEAAAKVIDVARRTNRVVQVGTEQRSWPHFAEARALLPELGGVTHIVLQYGGGTLPTTDPVVPVPAGLNWDMFQGPAPRKPYKASRQRGWRYYWDYGGGLETDWGVHLADTALWFMNAQTKAPKLTTGVQQFVGVENPDLDRPGNVFQMSWEYDTFVMSYGNMVIGNPDFPLHGTVFFGPRGSMVVNRTGYMVRPPEAGIGGGRGRAGGGPAGPGPTTGRAAAPPPAAPVAPPKPPLETKVVTAGPELEMVVTATTLHAKDFLECVKSRKKPVSDVEIGFYATLPCVLGIKAMRDGKAYAWDSAGMKPKAV